MTLYIIGIGLNDEKDITVKGLEAVKKADFVYLESYTSKLSVGVDKLEKFYKKKIILADRDIVEKQAEKTILHNAKQKNAAFLVIGDAMSATTHIDLMLRAKELGLQIEVIQNASVLNAVGITGLQLYKFGKTGSIPFEDKGFKPETPYDVIKQNQKIKAHTLLLLDLRPAENRYMTVNQAIEYLLGIEAKRKEKVFTEKTFCIGCARLGSSNQIIKSGTAKELMKKDFGEAPHCLIIPSKMHFMEEEALKMWK